MRRITLMFMATVALVILLFSYRTSTRSTPAVAAAQSAPGIVSGGHASGSTGSSAAGPDPQASKSPSAATGSTVVNGSVAETRWGPVQVQVTIAGGRITDVQAIQQPNENGRDQEINASALPQLHDQVLQAQSARIDGVSG